MTIQISPTLNIPITGSPVQDIKPGPEIKSVAILGEDYIGMRPKLLAKAGDKVKIGQPLFEDKKTPGVLFTSPVSGTVRDIYRGAKRKFLAMVVDADGSSASTASRISPALSTSMRRTPAGVSTLLGPATSTVSAPSGGQSSPNPGHIPQADARMLGSKSFSIP